tara:strand:+ start:168 stop:419 length:252 start_codon:yes stop_codon:yes gene_type:complete
MLCKKELEMRTLLIKFIDAYQLFFSPYFAGQCRFSPTCSNYAKDAIIKHGVIAGIWLTFCRLSKCHPWHEGGVDVVPQKQSNN